jgi:hypothetical protein
MPSLTCFRYFVSCTYSAAERCICRWSTYLDIDECTTAAGRHVIDRHFCCPVVIAGIDTQLKASKHTRHTLLNTCKALVNSKIMIYVF